MVAVGLTRQLRVLLRESIVTAYALHARFEDAPEPAENKISVASNETLGVLMRNH
jgi:hypothetical protein